MDPVLISGVQTKQMDSQIHSSDSIPIVHVHRQIHRQVYTQSTTGPVVECIGMYIDRLTTEDLPQQIDRQMHRQMSTTRPPVRRTYTDGQNERQMGRQIPPRVLPEQIDVFNQINRQLSRQITPRVLPGQIDGYADRWIEHAKNSFTLDMKCRQLVYLWKIPQTDCWIDKQVDRWMDC